MELFWWLYIFIVGLVLGSFFNVVGRRLPKGESIIQPRSHCESCRQTLKAVDLVPVLSFVILKGKCRMCGIKIAFIYPLLELISGILFSAALITFGWSWHFVAVILLISLLLIITVSDMEFMLIPDKILIVFAILIFLLRVTMAPLDPWWALLAGSVVGFSLLLFIAIISKGGMGGGDIKLFAVLGLFFGVQEIILVLFLSIFLGAFLGGLGILIGKIKRGTPMAFGPDIAGGSLITLFFGNEIVQWYYHFY
ncbi:A24 family peptidase [Alteribacillus sp. JSM 102045]|uniref:prepilin peptidase n=1 Tax=Alteribacillus sp. JSM 102045 TaxID=1562101 RepID=UPI0035C1316B